MGGGGEPRKNPFRIGLRKNREILFSELVVVNNVRETVIINTDDDWGILASEKHRLRTNQRSWFSLVNVLTLNKRWIHINVDLSQMLNKPAQSHLLPWLRQCWLYRIAKGVMKTLSRTESQLTILKLDPTCIYLPKVNNRNKIRHDMCLKLNEDTRTKWYTISFQQI